MNWSSGEEGFGGFVYLVSRQKKSADNICQIYPIFPSPSFLYRPCATAYAIAAMNDDPNRNEAACHPVESSNDPDASVAKECVAMLPSRP